MLFLWVNPAASSRHVNLATRGMNTLDPVCTNVKDAYKAAPLPDVGNSDHSAGVLIPAYRPRVERDRPVVREVRMWPQVATPALQDLTVGHFQRGSNT